MSSIKCRKSTRNKRSPLKDKTNDTLRNVRTLKVDFGSLKSNSLKHKDPKSCSQQLKLRTNLYCKSPQLNLQSINTELNLRTRLRGNKQKVEPQKCEKYGTIDSDQNLSSMRNQPTTRKTVVHKNVTKPKTSVVNKPSKSSQLYNTCTDTKSISNGASLRTKRAIKENIPNDVVPVLNSKAKNTKVSQKNALKHNPSEASKISNKNLNVPTVHFESDEDSLGKFTKVLRKRNTKNYRDLSLINNESVKEKEDKSNQEESEPKEHVPIYLQKEKLKPVENHKDPYEFVLLSPTRKKGKQPLNAEDSSDSDSNLYDKTMHDVLKNVRRKVLTKAKNRQHIVVNKENTIKKVKNNLLKNKNVRNTKINNVSTVGNDLGQNLKSKQPKVNLPAQNENLRVQPRNKLVENNKINVKNKPGSNTNATSKNQQKNVNTNITLQLNPGNANKNKENVAVLIKNKSEEKNNLPTKSSEESHQFFGFSDDEEDEEEVIKEMSRILPEPSARVTSITNIKSVEQNPLLKKFTLLTSTPLPNKQRVLPSKIQLDSSKQINIISNIVLSPPSNTPVRNITIQTPNKSVIVSRSPTFRRRMITRPWRGDNLNITRNPHWLAMKDTSLPSYNQEMVLEPKLLEKTDVTKSPAYTEESKKQDNMVQSSILNFIDSNVLHSPARIQNSTLFDESNFSPLKVITKHKEITEIPAKTKVKTPIRSNKKQNKSPARNSNKTPNENLVESYKNVRYKTRSKRNILEAIENSIPSEKQSSPNLENYFGFEDEETGKENVRVLRKTRPIKKNEDARPMRVELKQLKKVREEAAEKLLDKIIHEEPQPLPQSPVKESNDDAQEDVGQVGLFEDFEEVRPARKSYERKRRRRVRFPSVDSEPEEQEGGKPKRKRKDVRTHAEEEEFNKWAAQFNAMCEEVEQHTLEME